MCSINLFRTTVFCMVILICHESNNCNNYAKCQSTSSTNPSFVPYEEYAKIVQEKDTAVREKGEAVQKSKIFAQQMYLDKCSVHHRRAQKFFQSKYLSQSFVEKHPAYKRICDDHRQKEADEYFQGNPMIPIDFYKKVRFESLNETMQQHFMSKKLQNKRIPQGQMWPLFLQWLSEHPEDWNTTDCDERLRVFHEEYQTATHNGLTSQLFLYCINKWWERSSAILKLPISPNMTSSVFIKFLRVTNPAYVATSCGELLRRVFERNPVRISEEQWANEWVEESELNLDISPEILKLGLYTP